MTERKFYKTVFKIEVLSEEPLGDVSLHDLQYAITEGDCSGVVSRESEKRLDGKQAAEALIDQGSDSGFFQLTEDGEDEV